MAELTDAKNNQAKIDLAQKIESLIENDNAYGSNIELLSFKLTDDNITGKFRDIWNRRVFAYSIIKGRLGYRPAINVKTTDRVEEISKKLDNFSLGYNTIFAVTKLDSIKQQKPRCTSISFSCGKICLDINKICWIDDGPQKTGATKDNSNIYKTRIKEIQTLAKSLQNQNQNTWINNPNNNSSQSQIQRAKKGKKTKSFARSTIESVGAEMDEMFKTGYSELTQYRIRKALLGLEKELTGQEVVKCFNQIGLLAEKRIQNLLKEKESIESQAKIIEQKEGYGEADIFRSNNWSNDLEKLTDSPNKSLNDIGRQFLIVQSPSKMKSIDIGVFKSNSSKFGIGTRVGSLDKKDLKRITNGIEIFKALVGVDTLNNKTIGIAGIDPSSGNNRSFYVGSSIHIANNAPVETVVHELAHWLEESDPIIQSKVQDFFNKRTAGESWQPLSKLTGNSNYGDDEVAKPDKWIRPYMGKKINDNNSEILSMGMEMIYKAPMDFAKADPEYFAFIYDTLRGK